MARTERRDRPFRLGPGLRQAFTLVELLVCLSVLSLVVYTIYDLFVGGLKASQREEGKSEALQSSVLAYEQLATDLQQHYWYGLQAHDLAKPSVSISADGHAIVFNKFRGITFKAGKRPQGYMETLRYELLDSGQPGFKYLGRNGVAQKAIKLVDLDFRLVTVERSDHTPIYLVALRIYGYGERARDDNVLAALVCLDSASRRGQNMWAVENPYMVMGATVAADGSGK